MGEGLFLVQGILYLGAAVLAVLISHRLGLGSIAGYLLAGIAIGPAGFKFVTQVEDVRRVAELGVVFLMFVIGLELEPKRLLAMKTKLLVLGGSQVAGSIAVILSLALLAGFDWRTGLIVGMALALSSTALAITPLEARGGLHTQAGQATFSVLLFQDLAVIPMLAVLPLLATQSASGAATAPWYLSLGIALAAIVATLVGGHFVVRRVFQHIARTRLREIFTAFALFLVILIAWTFEHVGLSMALGAFLAGVVLADSEYRHEIEAAVEPFKGLLLGLFFISVGMTVDVGLLLARPLLILALVAGLFAAKGLVLALIAWRAGISLRERPLFILLLAQGGEFAFVLLGLAAAQGGISKPVAQAVTLAVTLSMLLTPLLLVLHDRWLTARAADVPARAADTPEHGTVIVAGLGRMGQVVARMLHASGLDPVILDDDPDHVEQSRRFGFKVFYGDATRLDLLHAAGAEHAELIVIALDDAEATSKLARLVQKHFPNLKIVARARDMRHLFTLRDAGVAHVERETFRSALALGELVLVQATGSATLARRAAETFADHDAEVVAKLYEVHQRTPDAHVNVSNELRDQLARTFAEDVERTHVPGGRARP